MAVFRQLKTKCVCGAKSNPEAECSCERHDTYSYAFVFRGKQYQRRTTATTKAEALKIEAALLKGLRSERAAEVLAFFHSDESRLRRSCATIGDVIKAYEAAAPTWIKSPKGILRNVSDMLLVVAYGLDLWTLNKEGGRPGTAAGAKIPDRERICALSCGRLDRALVRKYYAARQGKPEPVWRELPENVAINATLQHCRNLFGRNAREHALEGVKLPDMTEFMTAKLLPAPEPKPQPLSGEEFAGVVAAAEAVRESDEELWLTDLIFRRTGLRSYYVEALRGTWIEEFGGKYFIKVCDRPDEGFLKKPSTKDQFIPLDDELAGLLRQRGKGYILLPNGAPSTRAELVDRKHNALVKGVCGGLGEKTQGNHRLRDTVASALACLYGIHKAQEALGHMDPGTTSRHYAGAMPGVPECIKRELVAWGAEVKQAAA